MNLNFVVETLFIWMSLGPQIFILKSGGLNTKGIFPLLSHKRLGSVVVRGVTCDAWGYLFNSLKSHMTTMKKKY
jgi:hypothetical protein